MKLRINLLKNKEKLNNKMTMLGMKKKIKKLRKIIIKIKMNKTKKIM